MVQPALLSRMVLLDLRAGRHGDAAAHLREALQLALRNGTWNADYLNPCGHLGAATGRPAEAVTAWAAYAALMSREEDWPGDARHRHEPLHAARQALGPGRARAAGERGAARHGARRGRSPPRVPRSRAPSASGPAGAAGPGGDGRRGGGHRHSYQYSRNRAQRYRDIGRLPYEPAR